MSRPVTKIAMINNKNCWTGLINDHTIRFLIYQVDLAAVVSSHVVISTTNVEKKDTCQEIILVVVRKCC